MKMPRNLISSNENSFRSEHIPMTGQSVVLGFASDLQMPLCVKSSWDQLALLVDPK